MDSATRRVRIILAFVLVPLVAPGIVVAGCVILLFVPGLSRGVQPVVLTMLDANGWSSVPFFFYFFGTPVAYFLALLVSLRFVRSLFRGMTPPRRALVRTSALAGTVALAVLFSNSRYVFGPDSLGPAAVGLLAGAVCGWLAWAIAFGARRPAPPAA